MASNKTTVRIAEDGSITYTPGEVKYPAIREEKWIGGLIASAELLGGIQGYVDDEGIVKGRPRNLVASSLSKYSQTFFGPWVGSLTPLQLEKFKKMVNPA